MFYFTRKHGLRDWLNVADGDHLLCILFQINVFLALNPFRVWYGRQAVPIPTCAIPTTRPIMRTVVSTRVDVKPMTVSI